jgi:hypothetical protein
LPSRSKERSWPEIGGNLANVGSKVDEARLTADIVELARQYGRYGYCNDGPRFPVMARWTTLLKTCGRGAKFKDKLLIILSVRKNV